MTLETAFYMIGIIAMSLWIIIVVALIAMWFYIRRQVQMFKENMEAFQQGIPGKILAFLRQRNVEVATGVGLSLTSVILEKVKKALKRKKS